LRTVPAAAPAVSSRYDREPGEETHIGSNNWAVAGGRTADGRALLADDMHLGHAVPNVWYRAALVWQEEDDCPAEHRAVGVTLPGTPVVVAGSNSHVAWGYTNTTGDWVDIVLVEPDPDDPQRYLTPDGPRRFEMELETIRVRGQESEALEVESTIWGPLIAPDHQGRRRALRWIAHDPEAVNQGMLGLEHARTVKQAIEVANRSGIPPQNFVCADREGHIGWTVMGKIPLRTGFDGKLPVSWADGSRRWSGWLSPEDYPRLVDPPSDILWTANARVVEGEALRQIGDGGYALGARSKQIRDRLLALEKPTERDLLAVQLDDRAIFLERWRGLVLELLEATPGQGQQQREEFRRLVEETWTGRASVDSVAYRLVRVFRLAVFEKVYGALTARCREVDPRFRIQTIAQWEGPLWKLVSEKPAHLLDPHHSSWEELLLAAVDRTIADLVQEGRPLAERTWGERNTVAVQHPLSRAIPALARFLDMPRRALPGDTDMPRVQGVRTGASERFVVSPGREAEGIFHMPAGQSGHPLSPYYRAGHDAWAEGRDTPFLPGAPRAVLRLEPSSGS
jgi:penicillin amidase